MKVIIDRFEGRFEGDFAVVEMEDKTMVDIPRVLVPDAKEGDIVSITIDKEDTQERGKRIGELMDEVWE